MAGTEIFTYDDVLVHLRKNKREKHLLLGNGFSMAYDSKIFSYNALNKFIESLDNELLKKLFSIVHNKNFELVNAAIRQFSRNS